MKTKWSLFLMVTLMLAGRMAAQTFTTLHNFTASTGSFPTIINSDGVLPQSGLILSGNTLYGTALSGGSLGAGTVFAINTDGTGFTNLHTFARRTSPPATAEGGLPYAGLILSGNTLRGTTAYGGTSVHGTVFAVNTDGSGFTNVSIALANHLNPADAFPHAGLVLSGNMLYGALALGGSSGSGRVFTISTNGSAITALYNFTALNNSTNSDGKDPQATLILSSNILYGTTRAGGSSGNGTVFAVNTNGTGFTNLHSFTALINATNSDGANPFASLLLLGNTLYGTATSGGNGSNGTVFAIKTDGSGFTTLHNFTALTANTNSDGAGPNAGLILSGNTLYGTAYNGGSSGSGTVFAVNTDGTGFTNLYNFTALNNLTNNDGANPVASLFLSGSTLYGTAMRGGSSGNGTVFSLSFAPQLTIIALGTNVVLTWPTNQAGFDYSGFTLQSAPQVAGTYTNIPGATSPYTNLFIGSQQFFRLIAN